MTLAEVTRRKEVDGDRGSGSLNCSNRAAATELEPRREHAEFLIRELAHRGNNQLAVVKGMAVQNGGPVGSITRAGAARSSGRHSKPPSKGTGEGAFRIIANLRRQLRQAHASGGETMARELQAQFAQESKRREAGSLAEDPHQGRAGDLGFRGKRVERPAPRPPASSSSSIACTSMRIRWNAFPGPRRSTIAAGSAAMIRLSGAAWNCRRPQINSVSLSSSVFIFILTALLNSMRMGALMRPSRPADRTTWASPCGSNRRWPAWS